MATRNNATKLATLGLSLVMVMTVGLVGAVAGEPKTKTDAALTTLPTDRESVNARLTSRYSDPKNVRLINELTTERAVAMYAEISKMVDARHVSPTSYDVRVKRSTNNLLVAVENPAFLKANGINPSKESVEKVKVALNALLDGSPVRTMNDSVSAFRWVAEVMNTNMRVRPSAVAMEFVYSSLESLDKFSGFVPPAKTGGPSVVVEDHVVGIGVEIDPHDMGAHVVKVLAEGPAYEAGLKKDDLIVSVNGKSVKGNSLDEVVDAITGPAGSKVTLGVSREEATKTLTMVRRSVALKSVSEVEMIGENHNVGYIKLEHFSETSTEEMESALNKLYAKGMESLIVDLRGNGGGLLTTAISISDMFLPKGTIVSTRGRLAEDNSMEVAKFDRTWKVPMVVLVDGNSASASEIFAAAIQENGRGVIVGRHSYGKGSVQTHFGLTTVNASVKLTTARFYSPNGRTMAGEGVEPDVRVEETTTAKNDRDIEAALTVTKGGTTTNVAKNTKPATNGNRG